MVKYRFYIVINMLLYKKFLVTENHSGYFCVPPRIYNIMGTLMLYTVFKHFVLSRGHEFKSPVSIQGYINFMDSSQNYCNWLFTNINKLLVPVHHATHSLVFREGSNKCFNFIGNVKNTAHCTHPWNKYFLR